MYWSKPILCSLSTRLLCGTEVLISLTLHMYFRVFNFHTSKAVRKTKYSRLQNNSNCGVGSRSVEVSIALRIWKWSISVFDCKPPRHSLAELIETCRALIVAVITIKLQFSNYYTLLVLHLDPHLAICVIAAKSVVQFTMLQRRSLS